MSLGKMLAGDSTKAAQGGIGAVPTHHLQLAASLPACDSGDRQACTCGACLEPFLMGLSESSVNLLNPLASNSPQILQLSVA